MSHFAERTKGSHITFRQNNRAQDGQYNLSLLGINFPEREFAASFFSDLTGQSGAMNAQCFAGNINMASKEGLHILGYFFSSCLWVTLDKCLVLSSYKIGVILPAKEVYYKAQLHATCWRRAGLEEDALRRVQLRDCLQSHIRQFHHSISLWLPTVLARAQSVVGAENQILTDSVNNFLFPKLLPGNQAQIFLASKHN